MSINPKAYNVSCNDKGFTNNDTGVIITIDSVLRRGKHSATLTFDYTVYDAIIAHILADAI